nr:MADS-box protein CMB1-like [Ipomoea batatas]
MLAESNKLLRRKLEENVAGIPLRLSWEDANQAIQQNRQLPPQSEGFFQPLGLNISGQIGYNSVGTDEVNVAASAHNINGFFPGWML